MSQLRVRAVDGRRITIFNTLGGTHRCVGWDQEIEAPRFENGELVAGKMFQGQPSPLVRWTFVGGESTVTETGDGYYRAHIVNGDLDYMCNVDGERTWIEPSLARATAANILARDEAAALALESDSVAQSPATIVTSDTASDAVHTSPAVAATHEQHPDH